MLVLYVGEWVEYCAVGDVGSGRFMLQGTEDKTVLEAKLFMEGVKLIIPLIWFGGVVWQ